MILSIITPVYNSSRYLRKCLDSLLLQDLPYDEYEIILVDDGSTDNSCEIAEEYCKRYDNIRLIRQTNSGASTARNRAIDEAQGVYVWFVDSDDYIKANILGSIYNKVKNDSLDMMFVDWQGCSEDGSLCDNSTHYRKFSKEIMTGNEYLRDCAGFLLLNAAYIIKRNLLIVTGIRLKTNACYEDTDFYFRLIPLAKKISMFEGRVYYYVNHPNSFSSMSTISEGKFQDLMDNLDLAHKYYQSNEITSNYFKRFRDIIVLTAFKMVATSGDSKLLYLLYLNITKHKITTLHTTQIKQIPIALFYNFFGYKATYFLSRILYAR